MTESRLEVERETPPRRRTAAGKVARVARLLGLSVCGLVLAAGMVITALAIRDGLTLSERVERDLGTLGWVLYGVVVLGSGIQAWAIVLLVRRRVSPLAAVRWGLVLFVATVSLYMVLFPRTDGLSVELFVAAGAACFATVLVLSSRQPARKSSRTSFWLFQASLGVLLLELVLRWLSVVAPNPLLVPQESSVLQRIEAHSIKPGYVHYGFPHNSSGFYDGEFVPASERSGSMVAVIGDSFSLSFVPHRAHYTTVCERELEGTQIYNIGVGGCGPEEYRQLLVADALGLEPDAVVVSVFVGNDLGDLRLHSSGKRIRSWFDRGGCRLYLTVSRLFKLARERDRGGARWSTNSNEVLTTEAELIEAFPWYADPLVDPGSYSQEAYLDFLTRRIPVAANPDPARVRALADVMVSMRSLAKKPFGVMLIPAEFQIEDKVWRAGVTAIGSEDFDRDEPQRSLKAVLEERGIPCLDLLPLCRAAKPLEHGNRHLYRLRDTHFGVLGNELAGRALAPFVQRLLGK